LFQAGVVFGNQCDGAFGAQGKRRLLRCGFHGRRGRRGGGRFREPPVSLLPEVVQGARSPRAAPEPLEKWLALEPRPSNALSAEARRGQP
jgi:hypothetical protein